MDYLTMTLLSMVMIGFNTFAVKLVSQNLHPSLLVVAKFGIGFVGLVIYFSCIKVPWVFNKHLLFAGLIGAWWSGIMVLYYTAIARGPISIVVPIFNLSLVVPAVLGFIFLNEPVTLSKILGIIFACIAMLLLSR